MYQSEIKQIVQPHEYSKPHYFVLSFVFASFGAKNPMFVEQEKYDIEESTCYRYRHDLFKSKNLVEDDRADNRSPKKHVATQLQFHKLNSISRE